MGPAIITVAAVHTITGGLAMRYLQTARNRNQGDNHINFENFENYVLDQFQPPYQIPELPEWENIKISQIEKHTLQCLMEDEFISEGFQKYKCPISKQLMREPVTLKCCHNKYCCEKSVAIDWFNQGKTICPIPTCSKQSNINNITQKSQPIEGVKYAIKYFRKRLLLTYQRQGLSDLFKQIINLAFSLDYFEEHLQLQNN